MDSDPNSGLVGRAFELALERHAGHVDKSSQLYLAHVVRVAARLSDPQDQVVALLHDIVEDTGTSFEDIAEMVGDEVTHSVDCLTKRKGEALVDCLARVASDARAWKVKMADVADNSDPIRLSMLAGDQQDRLATKYQKTLSLLSEAAA